MVMFKRLNLFDRPPPRYDKLQLLPAVIHCRCWWLCTTMDMPPCPTDGVESAERKSLTPTALIHTTGHAKTTTTCPNGQRTEQI